MTVRVTSYGVWCDPTARVVFDQAWSKGSIIADYLPESVRDRDDLQLVCNGRAASLADPVEDGAIVGYFLRPEGELVVGALVSALVSAGIRLIANALLPNKPGRDLRDDESPNYGFRRLQQVRSEGLPIQQVFGEIRSAGTIIREETDVIGIPPQSFYRALVSFGHGPIQGIGDLAADTDNANVPNTDDPANPIPDGVQIQENSAQNYSGTKVQLRRGTLEQTAVVGHPGAVVQRTVDLVLESDTFDSSTSTFAIPAQTQQLIQDADYASPTAVHPSSLYPSQSLTNDQVWDLYGETFDMTTSADRFEAILSFDRGLGFAAADGTFQDAGVKIGVRYRELDELGVPITTGPPGGWVRLPFESLIVNDSSQQFEIKVGHQFLDPQTYSPGTLGKAARFTKANQGHARLQSALGTSGSTNVPDTATHSVNGYPDALNTTIPGVYVEGWIKLNDTTTAGRKDVIASHWSDSEARGWAFYAENRTFGGSNYKVLRFAYYQGTFGSIRQIGESPGFSLPPTFQLTAGAWTFVAAHLVQNGQGATVQIFQGDQLVVTDTLTSLAVAPRTPTTRTDFDIGWAYRGTTTFPDTFDGDMDEVRIYSGRMLTTGNPNPNPQFYVTAHYNGGLGVPAEADPATAVAPLHFAALAFDTEDVSNVSSPDASTFANKAVFYQGASTGGAGVDCGTIDGQVLGGGTQEAKRLRGQVQLLRLNVDNQNARVFDDVRWLFLKEITDEEYRYPGIAYASLEVSATGQLNTSRPDSTWLVKGRLCPVWDGLSVDAPILVNQYTANPAWVVLCLLLDKVAGLGDQFTALDVDLVTLKAFADRCDEYVFDQRRPSLADEGTQYDFVDVQYDSTGAGGAGHFNIAWTTGQTYPSHWRVGTFLMLKLPEPDLGWIENAGPYVRLDDGVVTGYEITEIVNSVPPVVRVRYGRKAEGAPWIDGQSLSTNITGSPSDLTGTTARIESRHRRHEWNGELDTEKPAWEWIKDILRPAFAAPVLVGKRFSVRYEAPRQPIDVIGQGQILRRGDDGEAGASTFAFEYIDNEALPNSIQCQIRNKFRNYAYSPVTYKDPDTDDASTAVNETTISLDGVTHPAEAKRFALHTVLRNRLSTKRGSFELGIEAMPYTEGDVVYLAHELFKGGVSGRASVDSGSATAITIDRELVVTSGMSITVRSNEQDIISTVAIGSSPATYPKGWTLTVADLGFVPLKDDPWIAGVPVVAEIARQTAYEDGRRRVEWVEFTNDFFDDTALDTDYLDTSAIPVVSTVFASTLAADPLSPTASVRLSRQRDGTKVPKVYASWTAPDSWGQNVSKVGVYYRKLGGTWKLGREVGTRITSVEFTMKQGEPGEGFEVAVQPVSEAGTTKALEAGVRIPVQVPAAGDPPPPVSNVAYKVQDDTLVFTWTMPSGDGTPPLAVEARRGGWILGDVAFVTPVGSRADLQRVDFTAGTYEIRTRDAFGDYSSGVTIEVATSDVPGESGWLADFDTSIYEQEYSAFGSGWSL